jgi:bifunctional non-homologous end joining protein LigD
MALKHLAVAAAAKVTGQRGVQIWVPVRSGYTFADTRAWVEKVSRAIGRTVPELVSWEWRKDRRRGLARLDYTQNVINKTLVGQPQELPPL